jgi:hypothetical protein
MNDRESLLAKLRKIEALHAGATTDGERAAAEHARQRITATLKRYESADPPVEYRFTLDNPWSRKLFVALLRRYSIRPYRYHRQRFNTVMARVSRSFVADTLWPTFTELDRALHEHLDRITEDIITQGISRDTSEAEEVRGGLGEDQS